MKNPIVHFEIPADDVKRAKKFYEQTFGWVIHRFQLTSSEYFLVKTTEVDKEMKPTTPGTINGGIMRRNGSDQPFMNYIGVQSIDAMCSTIEAHGGKIIMAKKEIGDGMGWVAVFRDTEGNIMGLHQEEQG